MLRFGQEGRYETTPFCFSQPRAQSSRSLSAGPNKKNKEKKMLKNRGLLFKKTEPRRTEAADKDKQVFPE